jgi:hypothetical protein
MLTRIHGTYIDGPTARVTPYAAIDRIVLSHRNVADLRS